jgi:acyl carrier protein phosphodiesterase
MNFLAHLHLAEPTPESVLGNLLGDFVKGYPWDERFPRAVWKGIVEHRGVDAFTDQHSEWKKSRSLLPDHLRRFAGIVVDIYYDHFLHLHWEQFSGGESIDEFIHRVHTQLGSALHLAPDDSAEIIRMMIRERWLESYRTLSGVDMTLKRVSRRSEILKPIFEAAADLEKDLPQMEQHFLAFYPDLVRHVGELRSEIG